MRTHDDRLNRRKLTFPPSVVRREEETLGDVLDHSCYRPVAEESWRRDVVGPLLASLAWWRLAGDDGDAPAWLFWLLLLLPLLLPPPALPASHAINQPNTS